MAYTCRYISDDSYIIGDKDYGHELCRVDIREGLMECLTEDQIDRFLDRMAEDLNKMIADQTRVMEGG